MNLWHAATQIALYRRARHGAVRAEHAAIAREGLEPFATAVCTENLNPDVVMVKSTKYRG
jgi:hypothetical protein